MLLHRSRHAPRPLLPKYRKEDRGNEYQAKKSKRGERDEHWAQRVVCNRRRRRTRMVCRRAASRKTLGVYKTQQVHTERTPQAPGASKDQGSGDRLEGSLVTSGPLPSRVSDVLVASR